MLRAVMDTSVMVAGLRTRAGASHELLRLLREGRWTLVLSNTMASEYHEILHREAAVLNLTHAEVDKFLDVLSAHLAVWRGCDDLSVRAKGANLADFDRVLAKVPDAPPLPGDELPEGYKRP